MKFIILDYGCWGNKFAELPHCIMSANSEEGAKISQAGEYILNELRRRKELFSRIVAVNLNEYTELTGEAMPKILVAVDEMGSLNYHNPELMNPLLQAAREGGSYGVYLLLSSGSTGSFMYRISQYVKCNHALQMTDKHDYRYLVGAMKQFSLAVIMAGASLRTPARPALTLRSLWSSRPLCVFRAGQTGNAHRISVNSLCL